ncbi:processed acidic surface protein [Oceanobacillus sp. FSL W7-1293]|uniref:processed acidic surface protein n=1 Tax=Oceanobacillus sp. FSL W7-1293 TaxID=2921699 RepID=UPI0030CA6A0F
MRKKLLSICFALILMIGLLPSHAFALEADDSEVEEFIESIGWEVEDYEDYLAEYDWSLADFAEVSELGTPLNEEGLEELLDTYDLTYEELDTLFREEGLLLEDEEVLDSEIFMFMETTDVFIDFLLNEDSGESEDSFASLEEEEITDEHLESIAAAYGFSSIEELEELFNTYEDSINNYTSLLDVEYAAEYYATEDSSASDEDGWEDDDLWEEDDVWGENADFTADMFNTPLLTGEPIVDIYAMISVMFFETILDFQ